MLIGHPEYTPQVPDLEGYLEAHMEQDFRRDVASHLEPDELLLEFAVLRYGKQHHIGVLALRMHMLHEVGHRADVDQKMY